MNAETIQNALPEGDEPPPPGVRTMAIVRWALVVGMALVAVFAIWAYVRNADTSQDAQGQYHCPMHPQIVSSTPGQCPICGMDLVPIKVNANTADHADAHAGSEQAQYQCPMHPEIVSNDPNAKCSICGMDLELVQTNVPGLVPIELTADRVQMIGVKTAKAISMRMPNSLRTVGVLESNERSRLFVTTRYSGWIEKLLVNETGQPVKAGQIVAQIYSPEVLQAQEELLNALSWKQDAPVTAPHPGHVNISSALAVDARRRLELLGVAAQDINALVRRNKTESTVPLRAPATGHVVAKLILEGSAIAAGTPLLEMADLATLWLVADVYEGDLSRVKVGNSARFVTAAYPSETFTAKVKFVYPTVDSGARTLRVRLELKNAKGPSGLKLRPGMYGDVTLQTEVVTALMVPAEAVVDTANVQYVFLAHPQGRYEPRRVSTGLRRDNMVEIVEGLKAGDEVVTTANFLLDSESRLQATLRGQGETETAAPAAPPHAH